MVGVVLISTRNNICNLEYAKLKSHPDKGCHQNWQQNKSCNYLICRKLQLASKFE